MDSKFTPKGIDRVAIAHEAACSTESVSKAYRAKTSWHYTAKVRRAARVLGFPEPPISTLRPRKSDPTG